MTAAGAAVWRAFGVAALRLALWFALVFYGADELTAQRSARWLLYFGWERRLPYWPAFYPVYFSVFLLPWLLPLWIDEAKQIQCWERRMAWAIAIAGVLFIALPAQLGYAPADAGGWQAWADAAHLLAGRYNLLPSLHVALSLVTLAALLPHASRGLRWLLAVWSALLLPSVLLTHQHHLPDVLAGAVLGLWLAGPWGGDPSGERAGRSSSEGARP